jgi:predicted thioesterase
MEHAARQAVVPSLPAGHDTVGVEFDFRHLAPTPEGGTVTATAEVTGVEDRLITFAIEAHDGTELVGKGTHVRAVIDLERFARRVRRKMG